MELQLALGHDLFRCATWAAQISQRVRELGEDVDLRAAPPAQSPWADPARSLAAFVEAAEAFQAIGDEPSRVLVEGIVSSLARAPLCTVPPAQESPWAAEAATMSTHGALHSLCDVSERRPGRDPRLLREAPAPRPFEDTADPVEATRAFLHFNLTELELPTMEVCARMILEHREMPWEFVTDMARQVWDEARHAASFAQRLSELGGQVGDYAHTHSLWDMTSQQPLAVQLAIHQRTGEWAGVCGALWNAERFHRQEDHVTGDMMEFVARDEINHVGYGNKWVRHLCPDPAGVDQVVSAALARRAAFGRTSDGQPVFPFFPWACTRAGFTDEEREAMNQHAARLGTRFQPWA